MKNEKYIYHIVDKNLAKQAMESASYEAESLKLEGFIHLSYKNQILLVANSFYKSINNLSLFQIEQSSVGETLKVEFVKEAGQIFPHIYGDIKSSLIVKLINFPVQDDGTFLLPSEVV
ncbi:MAG: hypothetical protein COB02_10550 [Candidatus Cloacimonadota bacterium]|nr:MAG: hypothetical protein COB02_10550 [Candidatus Cloacimonadota bacterium]